MILVQNHYYPKPGKEEEVYMWRLHTSAVREKLGFSRGKVLRRLKGDAAYVIWECEYASQQARDRDNHKLEQSDEFKQVQAQMRTLITRFERSVWKVAE